jgi:hypothetical protein
MDDQLTLVIDLLINYFLEGLVEEARLNHLASSADPPSEVRNTEEHLLSYTDILSDVIHEDILQLPVA